MKSLIFSLLCVALVVTAAEDVADEVAAVKSAGDSEVFLRSDAPPPAPRVQAASSSITQCPRGWKQYEEKCFLFTNMSYTWPNADAFCQSLGSSLASVHDLWEYNFLKQLTWRAGFLTAWIGGYRFQSFYKWDDGTPFDYENWYQNSNYDCVFLNSQDTRGMSSSSCSNLHPFICSTRLNSC